MRYRTLLAIEELEKKLASSYKLPIFRGCAVVNKKGVEKLIDVIYSTLPTDIQLARKLLSNSDIKVEQNGVGNYENIYENLKKLEFGLSEGVSIAEYVVVRINILENLIDKINKSVPEELQKTKDITP